MTISTVRIGTPATGNTRFAVLIGSLIVALGVAPTGRPIAASVIPVHASFADSVVLSAGTQQHASGQNPFFASGQSLSVAGGGTGANAWRDTGQADSFAGTPNGQPSPASVIGFSIDAQQTAAQIKTSVLGSATASWADQLSFAGPTLPPYPTVDVAFTVHGLIENTFASPPASGVITAFDVQASATDLTSGQNLGGLLLNNVSSSGWTIDTEQAGNSITLAFIGSFVAHVPMSQTEPGMTDEFAIAISGDLNTAQASGLPGPFSAILDLSHTVSLDSIAFHDPVRGEQSPTSLGYATTINSGMAFPVTVPEPATVVLFISAAISVLFWQKRRD